MVYSTIQCWVCGRSRCGFPASDVIKDGLQYNAGGVVGVGVVALSVMAYRVVHSTILGVWQKWVWFLC